MKYLLNWWEIFSNFVIQSLYIYSPQLSNDIDIKILTKRRQQSTEFWMNNG